MSGPAPDVVCVGVVVADAIARVVDQLPTAGTLQLVEELTLHAGGPALDTASVLTLLGVRTSLWAKVGADRFGAFLIDVLDERGVERQGVTITADARTCATIVLVSSNGERTYLHFPGANAELRVEDLPLDALARIRCLHIGGALGLAALDGPAAAGLLERARARGVMTSVDTIFDGTGAWQRVLELLPHTDLFTASLAEALAISGEPTAREAARWLRAHGAADVVVKTGQDGCYVAGRDFEGHLGTFDVASIDGTGAGDAFCAGLLYGRLAGWPIEKSARLGSALGALATTAVGAVEGVASLQQALALADLSLEGADR